MRARFVIVAFCMVLSAGQPSRACAPEPQGEGRVVSITDARTVRLNDGREIRLSGLAPIASLATAAQAALQRIVGRAVSLHGETDVPDRYGRQHAVIFAAGDDRSVQEMLLAAGVAAHDGTVTVKDCLSAFARAEREARSAQIGLWARDGVVVRPGAQIDDSDIGSFTIVSGDIRSVRTQGGVTYLNFGRHWTKSLAVIIPSRARSAVERDGQTLSALEGRTVIARGYRAPRGIDATEAGQIEIVDRPTFTRSSGTGRNGTERGESRD